MQSNRISSEISLQKLFSAWPAVIPVFVQRGMICVGCSMSAFDTVAEAAANYSLDGDLFLAELNAAASGAGFSQKSG